VTSCVVAEAICAALLVRCQAGGPVRVQTSMLEAVTEAQRTAFNEPSCAPDGIFATQSGFVALTCRTDDEWRRLVGSLGDSEDLRAPVFRRAHDRVTHRAELNAVLESVLLSRPAAAWAHTLQSVGVPTARAAHDEEVLGRKEFWVWGHPRASPRPRRPPRRGRAALGTRWTARAASASTPSRTPHGRSTPFPFHLLESLVGRLASKLNGLGDM
jgi:crotonobetainyl-CoA:carnitine CoA-transferase CaiB-like acyl-CoA transferase